jgi:spore coat polysaccharide biosynthesis protein SpsF
VKGGNLFRAHSFESPEGFADLRLTVDEPGDLELVRALVTELGDQRDWRSYADHLRGHPALRALNHHHARNEGLERSLLKDKETP